jgi:hypothetical protein
MELDADPTSRYGVQPMMRRTHATCRKLVNAPSALMLLAVLVAGATGSAWRTVPAARVLVAWTFSRHDALQPDVTTTTGPRHAVRTDAARASRPSLGSRHGGVERREGAGGGDPAWISLAQAEAHASRTAGHAEREQARGIMAPGQPAPSTRAPPIA